jgi:ADP-heptose:LPS heptosyltransferase
MKKPVKIYMGMLGKFGDILCYLPIVAKVKEMIPNSKITFAISKQFSSIAPLIARDPNIDRIFITDQYMEGLNKYVESRDALPFVQAKFYNGQYYDLRSETEIKEQKKYDIVFETPRIWHKEKEWFRKRHVIQEYALHSCGINLKPSEMKIKLFPPKKKIKKGEYIVVHGETVDYRQYPYFNEIVEKLAEKYEIVDLKESKDWIKSAQLMRDAKLFVGIDSAPAWLSSAFNTKSIIIYGINHFSEASKSIYPINPKALYMQSYKKDFSDISVDVILSWADKIMRMKNGNN